MRRPKNPEAWLAKKLTRALASTGDITKDPNFKAALSESLFPKELYEEKPSSGVTSLDEWAAKAPRKKKGLRSAPRSDVDASLAEADQMRAANDFTGARPRHLVALYALFHKHVYGVHPGELAGKAWTAACLMAARILDREFSGDVQRIVSFIAWTWRREKRAHIRTTAGDRRRMGWRLQFSPSLVTDYRVELARDRQTG